MFIFGCNPQCTSFPLTILDELLIVRLQIPLGLLRCSQIEDWLENDVIQQSMSIEIEGKSVDEDFQELKNRLEVTALNAQLLILFYSHAFIIVAA